MDELDFQVGQAVVKNSGDYIFEGIVVSRFIKKSGAIRYVVEDSRGLLLIMSAKQLKPRESNEPT